VLEVNEAFVFDATRLIRHVHVLGNHSIYLRFGEDVKAQEFNPTTTRGCPERLHSPSDMESAVSPQVTAELTQILSNLVLGDNEIRAK
jgi:hypothetical protein